MRVATRLVRPFVYQEKGELQGFSIELWREIDQRLGVRSELGHGDADAIVYDAPILMYHASHEGKGMTEMVGSPFRRESYGIVFPTGSRYRKLVNEALLNLKEDGTYDRLYTRWFGTSQ